MRMRKNRGPLKKCCVLSADRERFNGEPVQIFAWKLAIRVSQPWISPFFFLLQRLPHLLSSFSRKCKFCRSTTGIIFSDSRKNRRDEDLKWCRVDRDHNDALEYDIWLTERSVPSTKLYRDAVVNDWRYQRQREGSTKREKDEKGERWRRRRREEGEKE